MSLFWTKKLGATASTAGHSQHPPPVAASGDCHNDAAWNWKQPPAGGSRSRNEGYPNSWMVYFMENPKNWRISGVAPLMESP